MRTRYCPKCKTFQDADHFWERCSACKDCTAPEGSRRGMPKGNNTRITTVIPDDVYRDIVRTAKARNVTMSRQISDMLSGMIGIPERRT